MLQNELINKTLNVNNSKPTHLNNVLPIIKEEINLPPASNDLSSQPCAVASGAKGIYPRNKNPTVDHQKLTAFLGSVQRNTDLTLHWYREEYTSFNNNKVKPRSQDVISKLTKLNGRNSYDKLGAYCDISDEIKTQLEVAAKDTFSITRLEETISADGLRALRNSKNEDDVNEFKYQKKRLSGIALGSFSKNIETQYYVPNSSSIIPLDFDKLDEVGPEELSRLKDLLCGLPEIVFCFTSISGAGLKAGLCVGPIKDDARFKQCVYFAEEWLKSIDSSLSLDTSGVDVRRLLFTSYDTDAHFNSTATPLVVPEDFVPSRLFINNTNDNTKTSSISKVGLNETTLALMGNGGDLTDNFACDEYNKDTLRIAAGELYRSKGGVLSQEAWYKDFVCPFKHLITIGWSEEEAYTLFDEVCQQMDGYVESKNRDRWDKQIPPTVGKPKTYKSLLKHAPKERLTKQVASKQAGPKRDNVSAYELDIRIISRIMEGKLSEVEIMNTLNVSTDEMDRAKARLEDLKGGGDSNRTIYNFMDKRIAHISDLHEQYSLLNIQDQPVVVVETEQGSILAMKELSLLLGDTVCFVGINDKEKPVYKPADECWRSSYGKNKLTEIVMTSAPTKKHQWNLFKGFGVSPKEGNCSGILKHIREVICSGNDVNYEAFLNLLAWQVQHVGEPSRIVVAIRSTEQQIGKSILTEYIEQVLGRSYYYTNDANRAFGTFNAVLRGKVLVVLDEAIFAKDLKLAAVIKSLVTAKTTPSEEKFVKQISLPSGINIWITTNEEHIAHIERSDARYWIITASPHMKGNFDYFTALTYERDNGGAEALLWTLLNRDVSNFTPARDVPQNNDELSIAKELSVAPLSTADWLLKSIASERLLGYHASTSTGLIFTEESAEWPDQNVKVKAGILYDAYTTWFNRTKAHNRNPSSNRSFWDVLTATGFTPDLNSRRIIPSIEELSEKLTTYIAGKNFIT